MAGPDEPPPPGGEPQNEAQSEPARPLASAAGATAGVERKARLAKDGCDTLEKVGDFLREAAVLIGTLGFLEVFVANANERAVASNQALDAMQSRVLPGLFSVEPRWAAMILAATAVAFGLGVLCHVGASRIREMIPARGDGISQR